VTVKAEKQALPSFFKKRIPRSVRAVPEVDGEGLGRRVEVVKGKRRVMAVVAATLAPAALALNQEQPSLAPALLLCDVILVLVVRRGVLAAARAELCLPAVQACAAHETTLFHTTSKAGLQAYHIRLRRFGVVSGSPVETAKFGEA
jgi:hypothetical protein